MKFKGPLELLEKYLSGKASPEEKEKVEQWYASFEEAKPVSEDAANLESVKERIYQKITDELNLQKPVVPFYRKLAFRLSAAAIIILLIGSYFLFLPQQKIKTTSVETAKATLENDVAPPAGNKAILVLDDGKKIELDSSANGTLAVQGKINVIKQNDGLIAYTGKPGNKVSYNTLSVPRGSKPMKLLLADGSEVWLNVASSITYPTAFAGVERKVEITGEVYFEIAKNKEMPFIVKKMNEDVEVKVLGTHFNVNAYEDEGSIKVTLLEGAVNVAKGNAGVLLKPGEQAQVYSDGQIKISGKEDLEGVMAWKNGRFYFDGADIKTIMRQVEKWYNVDIVYEANIPYSFVAKISRNVNVSDLFKILELTDLVHFKIEGNKITVMK
jgi:ferric-dicitrate binding protein FerR (iron transport regulator)